MSKLSVAHSLTSVSLLLPPKTWEGNQEILPNSKMHREILLNAKKYKLIHECEDTYYSKKTDSADPSTKPHTTNFQVVPTIVANINAKLLQNNQSYN